ncbi:MAG: hypothetical protein L6R43_11190 [Planctomycetes bacterium]|nr:hypothetical protein [Planctomycetota bacterium]
MAPDAREPFTLLVERRPVTGTGRIRGRALLEDGRPIEERAFACLWSEDGEAPAPGATMAELDPEGRFLLRDVPAGRWTVSVQSSGFTGKAAAPAMDEGGTVEVAVRCAPWPVPDPSTKEGLLRVAPAGAAARALTGWATEGDRRSRAFRVKGEELEAKVRALGLHAVWLSDPVAGTAAVASGITTEDASPVPMSLGPAGRVFLMPRGDGKERWVVVQDAAGTVILSNLETSLPGVPGKGYLLVLPPGEYGLTLSLGIARREPVTRSVTVRADEESVIE